MDSMAVQDILAWADQVLSLQRQKSAAAAAAVPILKWEPILIQQLPYHKHSHLHL